MRMTYIEWTLRILGCALVVVLGYGFICLMLVFGGD